MRARVPLIAALTSLSFLTAGCAVTSSPASDSSSPAATTFTQTEKQLGIQAAPTERLATTITPSTGTYGVAMPIKVSFDQSVPKKLRATVQQSIVIDSSKALPEGAWVWQSGSTVTFRTATFLPAHTTIRVSTPKRNHVYGMAGGNTYKSSGVSSSTLHISRNLTTTIVNRTHKAVVVMDGKKVRTMPISMGKKGWLTRSGIKVTGEKYRIQRMTSSEIGAAEFYDLQVPYAVRLTDSGEFMHAAPWAESRLGEYNGSHGCTNLSMSDGAWFFNRSIPGDPVITSGTGRAMETWNGPGAIWNIPWKTWAADSIGTATVNTPTVTAPANQAATTEKVTT